MKRNICCSLAGVFVVIFLATMTKTNDLYAFGPKGQNTATQCIDLDSGTVIGSANDCDLGLGRCVDSDCSSGSESEPIE